MAVLGGKGCRNLPIVATGLKYHCRESFGGLQGVLDGCNLGGDPAGGGSLMHVSLSSWDRRRRAALVAREIKHEIKPRDLDCGSRDQTRPAPWASFWGRRGAKEQVNKTLAVGCSRAPAFEPAEPLVDPLLQREHPEQDRDRQVRLCLREECLDLLQSTWGDPASSMQASAIDAFLKVPLRHAFFPQEMRVASCRQFNTQPHTIL